MSSFPASSAAKTQAEDLSSTQKAHPTPISEPDTSDEMNQSSEKQRLCRGGSSHGRRCF